MTPQPSPPCKTSPTALTDAERLHAALHRQQTIVNAAQAANADTLTAQSVNDAAQVTTTDTAEAKRLEAQGGKLSVTTPNTRAAW